MQTTTIVGLVLLVSGACGAIVSIALVARDQPLAWLGIVAGGALVLVAYALLEGAGRHLPAGKS